MIKMAKIVAGRVVNIVTFEDPAHAPIFVASDVARIGDIYEGGQFVSPAPVQNEPVTGGELPGVGDV